MTSQHEFDILKSTHRFLSEPENEIARSYYSSLYREFAVCDLKHYKSGNFALRWRSESEVLSAIGQSTCANARCHRHTNDDNTRSRLTTFEVPFSYIEHGQSLSALVKLVLCQKCAKKLSWKRDSDKLPPSSSHT